MKEILQFISNHTNINFLQYKQSTLRRRLNKRLEALNIDDYEEYLNYLKTHPEEVDNAFNVMLLGVSEFFRNPETFSAIQRYLGNIIARKQSDESIRLWSVGCSQGEEAYSLAILLAEILGDLEQYDIKIFASDINEEAINFGRSGIFPEKSLQNLTQKQVEKYFIKTNHDYQIKEFIRKAVVFCKHDINRDPPFLNIDLISCRNLLIYFNPQLQRKIIPIFNYSLIDQGYLVIGNSENIDEFSNIFQLIDTKNKIYLNQKDYNYQAPQVFYTHQLTFSNLTNPIKKENPQPSIREIAEETIAKTYEHPYVIIDSNQKIIESQGELRYYLSIKNSISGNILEMINPELHYELHTAIIKTQQKNIPHQTGKIHFHLFEQDHWVKINVKPVINSSTQPNYYLVIFKKEEPPKDYFAEKNEEPEADENKSNEHLIKSLKEELQAAKEHLETYRKKLEASEAESQSLTEELQSANEELKSANEELETSNEELQSLNEELNTKNRELRNTNEELENKRKELEEREAKYRTLVENCPDGILIHVNYKLVFLNQKAVEIFGGNSQEDFIGRSIYDFIHPSNKEFVNSRIKKIYGHKDDAQLKESIYLKLDGTPIYVETGGTYIEYGGQPASQVVFRDITDKKKNEEQLRRNQKLLESINQHINEGIFRSTPEDGVIYVNEPFAELFGYTSTQEVLETQGLELYADPQEREELIKKEEDEGGFSNKEVLFKRKDGSTFWGLLSSKRLTDENGQVFYDGAVRDITQQKEVENKLIEAKEKAEEMNRLKTNFLANMSHEVRTPINGIMGLAQVMEEEYGDTEGLNEYTQMIRESSERLLNTITSILDFSKLEAKEVNLSPAPINVNKKLRELIPHLKILADRKEIDLIEELEEQDFKIQIDENVFEQIINNLVGNAIKFTNKGSVTVKTSTKSKNNNGSIQIIDTGIGISEDNLEKIFSPFEQESKGHNRDYEGTGLGLSIVKKYVELFGGNIKVSSKKSEGSNFEIIMPL